MTTPAKRIKVEDMRVKENPQEEYKEFGNETLTEEKLGGTSIKVEGVKMEDADDVAMGEPSDDKPRIKELEDELLTMTKNYEDQKAETDERFAQVKINSQTLLKATEEGRLYAVKDQVEVRTNVNRQGKEGRTPLYYALLKGQLEIVKWVVEEGKADSDGWTPIYAASQKGNLEAVKCLVEEGNAEVDKATNDGSTPLRTVKSFSHEEVVKYLKGKSS